MKPIQCTCSTSGWCMQLQGGFISRDIIVIRYRNTFRWKEMVTSNTGICNRACEDKDTIGRHAVSVHCEIRLLWGVFAMNFPDTINDFRHYFFTEHQFDYIASGRSVAASSRATGRLEGRK